MILKPITSEKAVKMIDLDNTILFETSMTETKGTIKKEIEKIFKAKIVKVRTLITQNKKFAYVKFAKENPAIDIATKLGVM